jgi:hypothetical protein
VPLTGPDLVPVPFPEGPFTDPDDAKVRYRFRREGGAIGLEIDVAGSVHRSVVRYAIGSGDRGMRFVGFDERDRARLARISLFVHNSLTDLTALVPRHATDLDEILGRPLEAQALAKCLECHVTSLLKTDIPGGFRPLERRIGCEACHGPGAHHSRPRWVASPTSRSRGRSSPRPARSSSSAGNATSLRPASPWSRGTPRSSGSRPSPCP